SGHRAMRVVFWPVRANVCFPLVLGPGLRPASSSYGVKGRVDLWASSLSPNAVCGISTYTMVPSAPPGKFLLPADCGGSAWLFPKSSTRMETIHIEKVFDDPLAVLHLVERHGPYRVVPSYLSCSATPNAKGTAIHDGILPWFRGAWAANGQP